MNIKAVRKLADEELAKVEVMPKSALDGIAVTSDLGKAISVGIGRQIALKFHIWREENRWFNYEDGKWLYTFEQGIQISEKTYQKNHTKTHEELFEMFLNDQTKE